MFTPLNLATPLQRTKTMKTDLGDYFVDEVVTMLNHNRPQQMTDSQSHLVQIVTSSSIRPLDALKILVRAVDKPHKGRLCQQLSRLIFDIEGVNGNEESMAVPRANDFRRNWSKHLAAANRRTPAHVMALPRS
jgi:hypothetical protein